ncbi:hypothetical protein HPB52_024544 [Rhipicephalus sanguineus]|uniref:BPTI/Kunitz inhibitor domain-containing protein n=1 Tax=Rhipicephalus sanguineus TaxID=34632 RepID=A0A9D4YS52_RHISA|nr:hypothetical protein HPB52_024544 [Rhipicephalus sanguineus]
MQSSESQWCTGCLGGGSLPEHWNETKYSHNVTSEYSAVGLNPVCNETKYPGPCAGYFPRYFYNNVTKTCEKFIYGGCRANGNNFVTLEECQNTCWVAPPEVCTYPADTGPCKAYMTRFFYNTETRRCEQFVYGGCGGNGNNFLTYDACQKKCKTVFGVVPHA